MITSESLSDGTPLSVTLTVNEWLPICAGVGVQLNAPDIGLMLAPAGAPTRL